MRPLRFTAAAVSDDAPPRTKAISPVWSRGGERPGRRGRPTGPDLEAEMQILAVASEVTVCELCRVELLCKVRVRQLR